MGQMLSAWRVRNGFKWGLAGHKLCIFNELGSESLNFLNQTLQRSCQMLGLFLLLSASAWAEDSSTPSPSEPSPSPAARENVCINRITRLARIPKPMVDQFGRARVLAELAGLKFFTALRRGSIYTGQVTRMALKTDSQIIDEVRGFTNTRRSFWDSLEEVVQWIHQFREYPKVRERYLSAINTTHLNISNLERAKIALRESPESTVTVILNSKSSTYEDKDQVSGIAIEGGNQGPPEVRVFDSATQIEVQIVREKIEAEKFYAAIAAEGLAQALRFKRLQKLRERFLGSDIKLSEAAKKIHVKDVIEDPKKLKDMTVDEARHWVGLRIASLIDEEGKVRPYRGEISSTGSNPLIPESSRVQYVERLRGVASFLSETPARFVSVVPLELLQSGWKGLSTVTHWIDTVGTPLKLPAIILAFLTVSLRTAELRETLTVNEQDKMWAEVRSMAHSATSAEDLARELSVLIEDKFPNRSYQLALEVLDGRRVNFAYDPTVVDDKGKPLDQWYFDVAAKDVYPILKAVYEGTDKAPDGQPIYSARGALERRRKAAEDLNRILSK